MRFWSIGGRSTVGVKLSIPYTKTRMSPMVKFRSRKRAGSMKGSFAVAVWARNTQQAAARMPARVRI